MDKNNTEKSDEIDLVELLYNYLRYWKWIVASIILFLIIGIFVLFVLSKKYEPSLSILLNEDDKSKSVSSNSIDLESIGLLSTTNNIENEIIILSSPDLMRQVVKALNCNVTYSERHFLRKVEIYKDCPFSVVMNSNIDDYRGSCEFTIVKVSGKYKIEGEYIFEDNIQEIAYDANEFPVVFNIDNQVSFQINLNEEKLEEEKKYYINIDNVNTATRALTTKLTVGNSGKKSSVLQLSIVVNNIEKGVDILKELVKQYNDLNLKLNNEIAFNTSLFINERLKDISQELSNAEQNVVDYKQENRIADLNSEAQLFVSQTGQNEQKMLEIETQLNILKYIQAFINNTSNQTSIIPNMGISDVGLSQIISEYNNKLLTSNQLIQGTGEKNPARIRIIKELDNMRNGITNSLANVRKTYEVSRSELQQRSYVTSSRIKSVPKQERGLIEKVREQQIKENLFLFLMQKREETNLSIAARADKARIIISPQLDLLPISPKSKIILLATLALGVIFPVGIIFLKELFNTKISSHDELERLSTVPFLGEIGVNLTESRLPVLDSRNAVAEMFRSLRNNIQFIASKKKGFTILVTSTISGEGKSFISINLALSLASANKKVLLIGGDIRQPKLHEYFDASDFYKKNGFTNYLVSGYHRKDDYLQTPFPEYNNLQIMLSGTIPPNPNELLMHERVKELFEEVQEEYDYIIIDSAPVGLVSDSYLLSEYTDLTLYIVRENITPKDATNFINTQFTEGKLNNMYLVLNDTELKNNYKYGYGKGYGYQSK